VELISESKNYQVLSEYESVFLRIKGTSRLVVIGDFYGDPELALISPDESFCIMGGEGVIIYDLKEPFQGYRRNQSGQWREWGREDPDSIAWVSNIVLTDDKHAEIETEDGQKQILNLKADPLKD